MQPSDLHVIGCYYNFLGAQSPKKLFLDWIDYQLECGVSLHIGEFSVGEIPFVLDPKDTKLKNVNVIQIKGSAENQLWIREAIFNRVTKHLPDTAKYICLDDTDIRHTRSDWVLATIEMLQYHRLGQTWSHSVDLGHKHSIVPNDWGHETDRSFCWAWLQGDIEPQWAGDFGSSGKPPSYGIEPKHQALALGRTSKQTDWRAHTGYSWAYRRQTLNDLGGLLDWMITGASDWHQAYSYAGYLKGPDPEMSPGYQRRLAEFVRRCDLYVKQDIGCVEGTVVHGWHGKKVNRNYGTRMDVIHESKFDPDIDLVYDFNGIPAICGDNRKLRDGIRRLHAKTYPDLIDT